MTLTTGSVLLHLLTASPLGQWLGLSSYILLSLEIKNFRNYYFQVPPSSTDYDDACSNVMTQFCILSLSLVSLFFDLYLAFGLLRQVANKGPKGPAHDTATDTD
jgi:hypothetical protein